MNMFYKEHYIVIANKLNYQLNVVKAKLRKKGKNDALFYHLSGEMGMIYTLASHLADTFIVDNPKGFDRDRFFAVIKG